MNQNFPYKRELRQLATPALIEYHRNYTAAYSALPTYTGLGNARERGRIRAGLKRIEQIFVERGVKAQTVAPIADEPPAEPIAKSTSPKILCLVCLGVKGENCDCPPKIIALDSAFDERRLRTRGCAMNYKSYNYNKLWIDAVPLTSIQLQRRAAAQMMQLKLGEASRHAPFARTAHTAGERTYYAQAEQSAQNQAETYRQVCERMDATEGGGI